MIELVVKDIQTGVITISLMLDGLEERLNMINRDIEDIKKISRNENKLLEMKTSMSEMRIIVHDVNIKLDTTEEKNEHT